jgi:hypothetical protein
MREVIKKVAFRSNNSVRMMGNIFRSFIKYSHMRGGPFNSEGDSIQGTDDIESFPT